MQLALGAIILLIILLPGISFRKGYFSGEFSNQYTIRDFFQLFINTLFPSLIFYLIFLPIIYFFAKYYYDLTVLLGLISSNQIIIENSLSKIDQYKFQIITFQAFINFIAFVIGICLRNLVLTYSFDAKDKFLRYKNVWHYLLTGKFFLFRRSQIKLNRDRIEDVDITYINVIVVVGKETFNYSGTLVDYELSEAGALNLIYIKNAQRKPIEEEHFKNVEGHILVLKYENIINLNLTFIQAEETESGDIKLRMIE